MRHNFSPTKNPWVRYNIWCLKFAVYEPELGSNRVPFRVVAWMMCGTPSRGKSIVEH